MCCYFAAEEVGPEALQIMSRDSFSFVLPVNYVDAKKYHPSVRTFEKLGTLPDCVIRCLLDVLPPNIDIDPFIVFFYVSRGYIPVWLVNFFIDKQSNSVAPLTTKFFRAIHLIVMVRAQLINTGVGPRPVDLVPSESLPSTESTASEDGKSDTGKSA